MSSTSCLCPHPHFICKDPTSKSGHIPGFRVGMILGDTVQPSILSIETWLSFVLPEMWLILELLSERTCGTGRWACRSLAGVTVGGPRLRPSRAVLVVRGTTCAFKTVCVLTVMFPQPSCGSGRADRCAQSSLTWRPGACGAHVSCSCCGAPGCAAGYGRPSLSQFSPGVLS